MLRVSAFACVLLCALAVLAGSAVTPASAQQPAAPAAAAGFKRGATIVEFFSFPATVGEGAARTYADPPYPRLQSALARFNFDDLRQLGLDHMRVPVDLGEMAAQAAAVLPASIQVPASATAGTPRASSAALRSRDFAPTRAGTPMRSPR